MLRWQAGLGLGFPCQGFGAGAPSVRGFISCGAKWKVVMPGEDCPPMLCAEIAATGRRSSREAASWRSIA